MGERKVLNVRKEFVGKRHHHVTLLSRTEILSSWFWHHKTAQVAWRQARPVCDKNHGPFHYEVSGPLPTQNMGTWAHLEINTIPISMAQSQVSFVEKCLPSKYHFPDVSFPTYLPSSYRCLTCGNYVYKGRKFNSRKEDAKGENYLGLQIYRFYIRCPECLSEITFKVGVAWKGASLWLHFITKLRGVCTANFFCVKTAIDPKLLCFRRILKIPTMSLNTEQLGHSRWAWLMNKSWVTLLWCVCECRQRDWRSWRNREKLRRRKRRNPTTPCW